MKRETVRERGGGVGYGWGGMVGGEGTGHETDCDTMYNSVF